MRLKKSPLIHKQSDKKEKGNKEEIKTQRTNNKITDCNLTISIITLIVSGRSTPIKRQNLSDWILKKQQQTICYLQKKYLKYKSNKQIKNKSMEKTHHANTSQKKAEVL